MVSRAFFFASALCLSAAYGETQASPTYGLSHLLKTLPAVADSIRTPVPKGVSDEELETPARKAAKAAVPAAPRSVEKRVLEKENPFDWKAIREAAFRSLPKRPAPAVENKIPLVENKKPVTAQDRLLASLEKVSAPVSSAPTSDLSQFGSQAVAFSATQATGVATPSPAANAHFPRHSASTRSSQNHSNAQDYSSK
jgi:hypothetical protein